MSIDTAKLLILYGTCKKKQIFSTFLRINGVFLIFIIDKFVYFK